MKDKPIVMFKELLGWDTDGSAIRAVILGVSDHPALGTQDIATTSRVEHITYDQRGVPGEIETKNTRYRRA